ncbi:membrane protein [Ectothiorhodospira haloalkaliphila]|uniref:Membrane protein n=1 Tax=Ectothiorhodospira haloalkaliphila TaxID=421628 RepID=W8KEL8_9GAMM|nr:MULTISPECIES: DoxX family protein [Ectothiorhodospira]AHK78189.1 membrane protein [Ectothiorhodospira haloalkaliphila]MCG5495496.1 DoxX family protein [Ectothiorhodospira variabilis]MCG5499118.1 DoxX family protein [Ectothiorhodospira variabilis]MCG5503895.1 DoxX family protein [Ectothiorhodospira variabilis]MCG5506974.1 DoxX family protein [Ectothiorhodospira variabilis]
MNTSVPHRGQGAGHTLVRLVDAIARGFQYLPASLPALLLRIAVAIPFWRSGLTKWDGLQLSPGALWLFEHEFQLHLFGETYPMPLPVLSAYLAAIGEILLPILLVLGLGTRFAALGLLLMTVVIQLTIPDAWATHHLPWAAMLLAIMTWGPGRASLDHALARWYRRP